MAGHPALPTSGFLVWLPVAQMADSCPNWSSWLRLIKSIKIGQGRGAWGPWGAKPEQTEFRPYRMRLRGGGAAMDVEEEEGGDRLAEAWAYSPVLERLA